MLCQSLISLFLLFFVGKETIAKNFLTKLYKNSTVEVLYSENNSTLEFSALTDLYTETDVRISIGVRLSNAIFANHERIKLDMKKQEEISKKCDFYDDNGDKKYFPDDILSKMGDNLSNDDNDGGDVLVKKENGNEMHDGEAILYASTKRGNDIDNWKTILYASPRRESEDEIDKNIYIEPKLKTLAETEKWAIIKDQKLTLS